MKVLGILLISTLLSAVKSSVFNHGLDEEFYNNVLHEVYHPGISEHRTKEEVFIFEMWPIISVLIPESVKVSKFSKNMGMIDNFCAAETKIWPKVGKILDIAFESGSVSKTYVVEAKLDFTKPLNLEIHKESGSKQTSSVLSVSYAFEGLNTVKFWLQIPNFSQQTQDKIVAECIVVIDSLTIEKLTERTVDKSKFKDAESKSFENKYWNSIKDKSINAIMRINIMKSVVEKLILNGVGGKESEERNEKSWICLGPQFKHSVLKFISKSYESDQIIQNEQITTKERVRIVVDESGTKNDIDIDNFIKTAQACTKRAITFAESQPKTVILLEDFGYYNPFMYLNGVSFVAHTPLVFRNLRYFFGIDVDYFVSSFCETPLLEFSSPGASGSTLYMTQNKEIIAKTAEFRESVLILQFLQGYFLHVYQSPHTLLPKFYGFYTLKQSWGDNFQLIVTNSVFPPNIKIHVKYDLKGSTFRRKASKEELKKSSPTYRDVDFKRHHPQGIYLKLEDYKNLINQIKSDCRLLQSYQIMDYSLLLGVHYVDRPEQLNINGEETEEEPCVRNDFTNEHLTENNERLQEDVVKNTSNNDEERPILGVPATTASGKQLLLFYGIIDVLQSYQLDHKATHFVIRALVDEDEISLNRPDLYAKRFIEFFEEKAFKTLISCPELKLKRAITELGQEGNSQGGENVKNVEQPKRVTTRSKIRAYFETRGN